jgi:hypothetical protein
MINGKGMWKVLEKPGDRPKGHIPANQGHGQRRRTCRQRRLLEHICISLSKYFHPWRPVTLPKILNFRGTEMACLKVMNG